MLNINPVSTKTADYSKYNNIAAKKVLNLEHKTDSVSFSGKKNAEKKSKTGFFEGVKLVLGGAKDRIKDLVLYPIKHPVETIITGAVTTLAMSALPLIGISTFAGAAALGVAFAAFSTFNMAKNVKNAVGDYRAENDEKFRDDLRKIGGSCVDIALCTKSTKKNLRTLKHQFKYGKIALNKDLINDFKDKKKISEKLKTISSANSKINTQINKFAGIDKLQRELKFSDEIKQEYLKLYDIEDNEEFVSRAYKRLTTDLGYRNAKRNNAPVLVFDTSTDKNYIAAHDLNNNTIIINRKNAELYDKSNILASLRHELQHFQQHVDIERTQGLGLEKMYMLEKESNNQRALYELETNADFSSSTEEKAEAFIRNFKETLEQPETTFIKNPHKEFTDGKWHSDFSSYDPIMLNSKDRRNLFTNIRKIAQEQGEIKPGTKAAKRSKKLFDAYVNYSEAPYRKNCKNIFDYAVKFYKYYFNPMEVDAQLAEEVITPFSFYMWKDFIFGTAHVNKIKSTGKD